MSDNIETKIRKGSAADEQWLFNLFKETMQNFIDGAWGWEELFQKEGFATSLPAKNFLILESENTPIACLHASKKADHLFLDMILVEPAFQRQGFGSQLISLIMQEAKNANMPIRLSVIKANPAVRFHQNLGFEIIEEDEHSYRMQWHGA